MAPVLTKAAGLFAGAIMSSGFGTGMFAAQLVNGSFSLVGEVVAGGSFAFAVFLVRWSWKLVNEWKAIADQDRAEALNREQTLRTQLAEAWEEVANLRSQLVAAHQATADERALRISLEQAGVADRRNRGPIEGTPI